MRTELTLTIAVLYASAFAMVEANPALLSFNWAQAASAIALVLLFALLYNLSERLTTHERAGVLFSVAIVGILASVFMTYAHFVSASAFCPPLPQGEVVPCDLVNQSVYSTIFGIPVAILGLLFYALFGFMAYTQSYATVKNYPAWVYDSLYLHLLTIAAFVFTLWLNYVQFFLLSTLCLFCEISAATVVVMLLFSYQNWRDA